MYTWALYSEAVVRRYSVKKVFLEILENSQENTCTWDKDCNFIKKESLVQLFSCEFGKIYKNTFFYRTPLVAASVYSLAAHGVSAILRLHGVSMESPWTAHRVSAILYPRSRPLLISKLHIATRSQRVYFCEKFKGMNMSMYCC